MWTLHSPSFLISVLLTASLAVQAADDGASQRQRIERERADINARARSGEAACSERFAVSSCLAQVRAERREAMQQLDHQRALLDDALRKHRAADRQDRIRERQDAAARADESRLPPPATAASHAGSPAASPASAVRPDARRRNAAAAATEKAAAARRAAAAKRRAEEVAAHRAAVEQQNHERDAKRPPSQALPVPQTGAASAAVR